MATALERKLDALREFIIAYPRWEHYGIVPLKGQFLSFSQIAMEWFPMSSAQASQLALQMTGCDIVRKSNDPVWSMSIRGEASITRQANFMLQLLTDSYTSDTRADTNEFMLDFIEWLDEMNIRRQVPLFGNVRLDERTWASNGSFLAPWGEGEVASVYGIQLHKIYTTDYSYLEDE